MSAALYPRPPSPSSSAAAPIPYYHFPDNVLMTGTIKQVRDTNHMRQYNQYIVVQKLGKGQHGTVWKAYDNNKDNMVVAIKACKRRNIQEERNNMLRQNNPRAHGGGTVRTDQVETAVKKIRKEIAIMKKCNHGQIVRLFEVIDDRSTNKILMVMEYMDGGQVHWCDKEGRPVLRVDQARRICLDVTLGLEYLHHQGIIHRDIKPANLLWTADRKNVKISDFGVSHFSFAQRLASHKNSSAVLSTAPEDPILFDESDLSKTAGTPFFLAPEIIWTPPLDSQRAQMSCSDNHAMERPPVTKAIDVWALGITLYCLLFGRTPWTNSVNEGRNLYAVIPWDDFEVDANMGVDKIRTGGRHHDAGDQSEGGIVVNLLQRLLEKDYRRRITLDEIKRLSWILRDIQHPEEWLRETAPDRHEAVKVSADETDGALIEVKFRWRDRISRVLRGLRSPRRANDPAASVDMRTGRSRVARRTETEFDLGPFPSSVTSSSASTQSGQGEQSTTRKPPLVQRKSSRSRRIAHILEKPFSAPTSRNKSTSELTRPGPSLSRERTHGSEGSRLFAHRSPTPKPRRGSESLLTQSGPSSTLGTPSTSPTTGYTSDEYPFEKSEHDERVPEKQRSRLSLWRKWTSGPRSPGGSELDTQPPTPVLQPPSPTKSKGRGKSREQEEVKEKQTVPAVLKTPLPQRLARRSADEFKRVREPSVVVAGSLTDAMRAASWGDVADEHERSGYDDVELDILASDDSDWDWDAGSVPGFDRTDDAFLNIGLAAGATAGTGAGNNGAVLSNPSSPRSLRSGAGLEVTIPAGETLHLPNGLGFAAPEDSDATAHIVLPLLQPQPGRLLDPLDSPVAPDPAMHDATFGPYGQMYDHWHGHGGHRPHTLSPLAQSAYSVHDGVGGSVFEDDDERGAAADRVYGQGSSTIYDDDDDYGEDEDAVNGDDDDSSDDEPLAIKTRRPSESFARARSMDRPEIDTSHVP